MGWFSKDEKIDSAYYEKLAKEEIRRGNSLGARGRANAAYWTKEVEKARKDEKRRAR